MVNNVFHHSNEGITWVRTSFNVFYVTRWVNVVLYQYEKKK
jgi:hypothetical protein